jgi:3-oxoacyl-[acyl-carrier protein] reductase
MMLSGLNAVITGGSQGFGRHIVDAFINHGANVVFCARNAADVDRAAKEMLSTLPTGQRVRGVVCDVSAPDQVQALFQQAAEFGQLHIVVNNAGVYGPIGPTEDVALTEWINALQINLTGPFLVSQHAIRAMKPNGWGRIINISGGGATSPMPRLASYASTKAALVRLTETLAEELRDFGIAVNAVAPGALHTRLMEQVLSAGPELAGAAFFEKNKKWVEGGAVDPRLGAALCVYLASRDSDGITGKLISAQWDPWQKLQSLRAELAGDIYTLRRIVPEDRGKKFPN